MSEWIKGTPPLFVGFCYLLQFSEGDRFLCVKVVDFCGELHLESLEEDGGWVSDIPESFLLIPEPPKLDQKTQKHG